MIKIILPLLVIAILGTGIFFLTEQTQNTQKITSFAQFSDTESGSDPRPYINVKDFNAKGDGRTDDTKAFNDALEEARKDKRIPKKIYIPNGFYLISSLNLTNGSIKIEGESMAGVRLMATEQTKSIPVLDLTGAQYSEIENLTIIGGGSRFDGQESTIKPAIGILMAGQKNNPAGATKFLLKNIMVRGEFATAAVYIYGTCCNSYINLYADSYLDGVPGLVVTGTNRLNVTSPYVEIATGLQDTVDLNFIEAEIHDLSNVGFDGKRISAGQSKAVLIDNVRSLGFIGGVFSSCGGSSIVEFLGVNKFVSFERSTFASAEGSCPKAPMHTFYNNDTVTGLTLSNINVDGGVSDQGGVVAGSNKAFFNGLVIEGSVKDANRFNSKAQLILIEGHQSPETTVISNSRIMADGLTISPGGSITTTHIIDPGIMALISGARDSSTKSK